MELDSYYEIARTSDFIRRGKFTRVALQFPDELLKDSTKVLSLLRSELLATKADDGVDKDVGLFVLADTTFGSCCVDEVGALHINADCVIHYGHTCFSPTSTLPAFFVFGKAPINTLNCVENLLSYASTVDKPVMVLYGLEYAHAMSGIKEAIGPLKSRESSSKIEILFADAIGSAINPSKKFDDAHENLRMGDTSNNNDDPTVIKYKIGGLAWNIPQGTKMEDFILFWIGSENPAFANVVMTFNSCDIVRYDADKDRLVTDFSHHKRILKRRYFIVEKAKDANMVGILVGTLGVAGYLSMIDQMKELVTGAGKKAYTLVMGRPNPAKLANFPECDVFIYVSCAQTALLDSKEFMAPIITPFEAMLAFKSGSQWTGAYVMEFRDLVSSSKTEHKKPAVEEARFSFFQGGYVEDQVVDDDDNVEEDSEAALVALATATEKVLQLRNDNNSNHGNKNSVVRKKTANSGAEYLAMRRSYQGLDLDGQDAVPDKFVTGRSGRASGYATEKETNYRG